MWLNGASYPECFIQDIVVELLAASRSSERCWPISGRTEDRKKRYKSKSDSCRTYRPFREKAGYVRQK